MQKLVVDLDGTLIIKHMYGLCAEYVGEEIDMSRIPKGMYLNNYFMSPKFKEFFKTHNLYKYGHLLPDCQRVLKDLNEKYDLFICSNWIFDSMEDLIGIIVQRKYDFIKENFPFLKPSQLLFSGNKKFINADIAIGDSASDLMGTKLNILIRATNISKEIKDVKNLHVVCSWKEIEKLL